MERVRIALKDFKPNPFKCFIVGGRLDTSKIERLRESIRQTGFWANVVCRRNNQGEYELGYGHKRIEAARLELGPDHILDTPVLDLTDHQMIQMMAMENALGETESVEAQVDVVRLARNHLRAHPEACVWEKNTRAGCARVFPKGALLKHEHGSLDCIAAFLGEGSWGKTKIKELLQFDEKLDPKVLKILTRGDAGGANSHTGRLAQSAGKALVQLRKETQRAVVTIAAEAKGRVTEDDISRVVRAAKNAPAERRHDAAVKEVRKVRDEVNARRSGRPRVPAATDNGMDGRRQSRDLLSYLVANLPLMRKASQVYERIAGFIEGLGENPFDRKEYRINLHVGEFRQLGGIIVKKHEQIFKGGENA